MYFNKTLIPYCKNSERILMNKINYEEFSIIIDVGINHLDVKPV